MNENRIKVLVADTHEIVKIGIKKLLSEYQGIEILAYASNGKETIEKTKKYLPDVVIMDDNFTDICSKNIVENIKKCSPGSKIIIHPSCINDENTVVELLAGATGYIPKNIKSENLLEAVIKVHIGEFHLKGNATDVFIKRYFKEKKENENLDRLALILSKREIEVMKYICDGISIKTVAAHLNISARTVEVHRKNIRKKLGIQKNADLVKFGIKNNVITI